MAKYRIFYYTNYRRDTFDYSYSEDIEADSDEDAKIKAKEFITKRSPSPHGEIYHLTGISMVTEEFEVVRILKEVVRKIPI